MRWKTGLGWMALAAVAASAEVPAAEVTYLPSGDVGKAFAKGAPLIEVTGYKVHASRREAPGLAEVHDRDTDIVYVLEGTARIVTGGTVTEPRVVAPDEVRGAAIRDGESRNLAPGDILVVPNGVPHWFQEVNGPFLYYVVKVPASGSVR